MRRCLGCPRLIRTGSRCRECAAAYRSSFSRHQWAAAVKMRDGYRCVRCGSADRVQAHHITALSTGGTDTLGNGETLCHAHHSAITEGRAA